MLCAVCVCSKVCLNADVCVFCVFLCVCVGRCVQIWFSEYVPSRPCDSVHTTMILSFHYRGAGIARW